MDIRVLCKLDLDLLRGWCMDKPKGKVKDKPKDKDTIDTHTVFRACQVVNPTRRLT